MIDLGFIQQNFAVLTDNFQQAPALFAAGFFVIYVLVTAASLPFATLLMLLGGALFGFWKGLLLVSFASSLGALLAMLASRYFLSGVVERKFGAQMEGINQGVAKDGAFYLFALRLTPVVPFFIVNLLMGLTKIRALTFYWASQLGMLAFTAVYVNAGTQLANLKSLSGIVSPTLLISFALIGLLPLVLKKVNVLVQQYQQTKRALKP